MPFTDTGLNLPETEATLRLQQEQLLKGKRLAQMFPLNTEEIDLPAGYMCLETGRGAFHFNPEVISAGAIKFLSDMERENILLGLGPYNKADILKMVQEGEKPLAITERTPEGVEVKAAIGTKRSSALQIEAFEKYKLEGSKVSIETIEQVLTWRRNNIWL